MAPEGDSIADTVVFSTVPGLVDDLICANGAKSVPRHLHANKRLRIPIIGDLVEIGQLMTAKLLEADG